MRVRFGFVSNSSASSFLIYGVYLEDMSGVTIGDEMAASMLEEINAYRSKYSSAPYTSIEDWASDDFNGVIHGIAKSIGVAYESMPECDGAFIGASWDEVGDEETGAQFKERVRAALVPVLGEDVRCGTIQEAWYDG